MIKDPLRQRDKGSFTHTCTQTLALTSNYITEGIEGISELERMRILKMLGNVLEFSIKRVNRYLVSIMKKGIDTLQ